MRGDYFRCGRIDFSFVIKKHRIEQVRITGDFFTSGDIEKLEKNFENVEYEKNSVLKVLQEADLEVLFGDVTAEELSRVLV